ncbi:hypothetical protein TrST_g13580 [Triparma strigata]|uniref:HMG box domain-containing protein n=1 Tax=Triparma strigata TaxID=1606541 RepID=A0A9W7DZM8_9STRA|nr:hypothetical protein TrST_g13580 [Triparma strigata]
MDSSINNMTNIIKNDDLQAFKDAYKGEGDWDTSIVQRAANSILTYILTLSPSLSFSPSPSNILPLHYSTTSRSARTALLFLERGVDVNAKDDLGYTALHAAVFAGGEESNWRVVEVLIKHGAKANICSHDGIHPYDLAVSFNDVKSAKIIANSLGGVIERAPSLLGDPTSSLASSLALLPPPSPLQEPGHPIPQPLPVPPPQQLPPQTPPQTLSPRRSSHRSPRKDSQFIKLPKGSPRKDSPRKAARPAKKAKTPVKGKKEKPDGPPKPRKSLSAYNFFFSSQSKKRKESKEKGSTFSQQGTAMGEQWKRLPPSEREPFLKLAAEDSKRYARDKVSLTEAWLAIQPNDVREAWLRKKGSARKRGGERQQQYAGYGIESQLTMVTSNTTSENTSENNSRGRGMSVFSSSNNSATANSSGSSQISDNRIDLLSSVAHVLDHVESKSTTLSSSSQSSQIPHPPPLPSSSSSSSHLRPLKNIQTPNPPLRSPSPPADSVSITSSLGSLMGMTSLPPPHMPPPLTVPGFTLENGKFRGSPDEQPMTDCVNGTRDSFNSLRGGSLADNSRGSLGGHSLSEAISGLMEENVDEEWN